MTKKVAGVHIDAVDEQAKPITEIGNSRPSRRTADTAIETLAASMAVEGLRHPVLLMPSGEVLKGRRRIAAARALGWTTIPAREVRTVEDAVDALEGTGDEHSMPRTIEEYVDLGLTIETLDHREPGTDKDYVLLIGAAVARSGGTYKRARLVVQAARSRTRPAYVVDIAKKALADMSAEVISVTMGETRVRTAIRSAPRQADGVMGDGLPSVPPPSPLARSSKARGLREQWIRALIEKGATTAQIAQTLGLNPESLRNMYKKMGVENTADAVLHGLQVRKGDPNKAMQVAMDDLDALVWSLERIDVLALDPEQAVDWAKRLNAYARGITRASKKIKGVTA